VISTVNDWKRSFDWASGYNEKLFGIIRRHAGDIIDIRQSDEHEDCKQATDFVITVSVGTVAARVRNRSFGRPFTDVTIRSYNKGMKTEIDKIAEGWGQYYVYYWAQCGSWIFYNLNKVREHELLSLPNMKEKSNFDGTKFVMLDVTDLYRNDCVIGCSPAVRRHINKHTVVSGKTSLFDF